MYKLSKPLCPCGLLSQLQQLKSQADGMADQHEAIRIVLEDLLSAASAGQTDERGWMERVKELLETGKPYVEFGNSLASLGNGLLK